MKLSSLLNLNRQVLKMSNSVSNQYLFHMMHELIDFRLPELDSVCSMIRPSIALKNHTYSDLTPLFTCELDSDDDAIQIAKRSFLLKSISNLYFKADSFDEIKRQISSQPFPLEIVKGETFKIEICTYGKSYSQSEKLKKIEELVDALRFDDHNLKVCLDDTLVKYRFVYMEDWINTGSDKIHTFKSCYFGRFLCAGQSQVVHKYNLKERSYIGNTSMNPLLSLVMANMAQVTKYSLMYDPFVGTGSLLVGAAHCGAHVSGADLDFNLMHARGLSSRSGQKYRSRNETIYNNLKQYGLHNHYIDAFVADFSTRYLRESFKFDAIITDPPYGIREKTKKTGSKKRDNPRIDSNNNSDLTDEEENEEKRACPQSLLEAAEATNRIPQRTKYMLGEIYNDLLTFAARHLSTGSRLVFWMPIYLENERREQSVTLFLFLLVNSLCLSVLRHLRLSKREVENVLRSFIPSNPHLDLLSFSEQRLTKPTSRILVTLQRNDLIYDNHEQQKENDDRQMSNLNRFRDNYFAPQK